MIYHKQKWITGEAALINETVAKEPNCIPLKSIANPDDMRTLLALLFTFLTPREVLLIKQRFYEERTYASIGQEHKVTPRRIADIIAKGFRKMRYRLRHNLLTNEEEYHAHIQLSWLAKSQCYSYLRPPREAEHE